VHTLTVANPDELLTDHRSPSTSASQRKPSPSGAARAATTCRS